LLISAKESADSSCLTVPNLAKLVPGVLNYENKRIYLKK